jgi:aminoethylphosphonate catabolism LysR family transcriptional regulator
MTLLPVRDATAHPLEAFRRHEIERFGIALLGQSVLESARSQFDKSYPIDTFSLWRVPAMAVNLTQLRVFHAVAKGGSFTEAARELSITQPAVTIHIRELERYYGVRLFDRGSRRVRLTDTGQTLLEYTQRIFSLAEEAEHALENAGELRAGRLRILASLTVGGYYLPPVINLFKGQFPQILVTLFVDNSQRVVERIAELREDIGFLSGPVRDERLLVRPFLEDELVLIVPPRHQWAGRRSVSLHELKGESLILREPGSATRALVEERLHQAEILPLVSMELGSNEAIKRAVEMGMGVSVLSATIVRREAEAGLVRVIRIREKGLTRLFQIIIHRERERSRLITAFLDVAAAAAPTL